MSAGANQGSASSRGSNGQYNPPRQPPNTDTRNWVAGSTTYNPYVDANNQLQGGRARTADPSAAGAVNQFDRDFYQRRR